MIATCARPDCENQFEDLSELQPIPKKYCTKTCKKSAGAKRYKKELRGVDGETPLSFWVASRSFKACLEQGQKSAENRGLDVDLFLDDVVNDLEELIEQFWAEERQSS